MDPEMDNHVEPQPLSYAPKGSLTRPGARFLPRIFLTLWIVLLCVVLLPSFKRTFSPPPPRSIRATRQLVSPGGQLSTAIELYREETGAYPRTLADLTTRPAHSTLEDEPGDQALVDPDALFDYWNKPLQYRVPGIHNPEGYDLWRVGPDRIDGTIDDIENW